MRIIKFTIILLSILLSVSLFQPQESFGQVQFDESSLVNLEKKIASAELGLTQRNLLAPMFESMSLEISPPTKEETRSDVTETISDFALQLNDKFAFSSVFLSSAKALELLSPEEAESVVGATDKLEKWLNRISISAAIAGVITLLTNSSEKARKALSLSSSTSAVLGSFQSSRNTSDLVDSINAKTPNWLNDAHERASDISRHAIIIVELEKVGTELNIISKNVLEFTNRDIPSSAEDTKEYLNNYIKILDRVDALYSTLFPQMRISIEKYSEYQILSESSREELETVAKTIDLAINAWNDARIVYRRSENLVFDYLSN